MKKITVCLLILGILLGMCACSGADAVSGTYVGKTVLADGEELDFFDVYAGLNTIVLSKDGTGTFTLENKDTAVTWKLEEESLTITADGKDSTGTLSEDVLTIDYMGQNVIMTFEKQDKPVSDTKERDIPGRYTLHSFEDDEGTRLNRTVIESLGLTENSYLDLRQDGTGTFAMAGESIEITYDETTLYVMEDLVPLNYRADTISLVIDDCIYNFVRTE